jgi:hypothetical protein
MSFFSSLVNGLKKALGVAEAFAPIGINIAETINPAVKVVGDSILTGISLAEAVAAPSSGPQKLTAATAFVNSVHPGLDQTKLTSVINDAVAALNLLTAALGKAPVPPATPPAQTP